MTTAVIYTRVSTVEQGSNFSLGTQLASCVAYAAEKNYLVVDKFSDTYTGTALERPGLDALLGCLRQQHVDVLIVHDIDRLSREAGNQAILEMELAHLGVRAEYVIGRYADTPEGDLSKLIKSAIAQYENRQRVERGRRGKRGKAQAGFVLTTHLRSLYGYTYVSEPHKGALVIDAAEAAIVRQMYAWVLEGHTTYAIARMLSERGVLTRADQNALLRKRAGRAAWAPGTVQRILRDSAYRGEWQYQKTRRVKKAGGVRQVATAAEERISVAVPAIVETVVWHAVQEQLQRNRQYARRRAKRDYLLRGLIHCRCGRQWIGVYPQRLQHGYYRCSAAERHGWLDDCAVEGGVRQERLEAAVWAKVEEVLLDPARLRAEIRLQRETAGASAAAQQQRLAAIEGALVEIRRKLGMLLDQMMVKGFGADLVEDRKRLLLAQQEELTAEAQRVQAAMEAAVMAPGQEESMVAFAEQVRRKLGEATMADKRHVLETLQVRIDVVSQEEFRVTALIPIGDGTVEVERLARSAQRKERGGDDGSLLPTSSPQNSRGR